LDPHGQAIQQMPVQWPLSLAGRKENECSGDEELRMKASKRNKRSVRTVRGIAWGGGSGVGISAKSRCRRTGGATWQTVDKEGIRPFVSRSERVKQWSLRSVELSFKYTATATVGRLLLEHSKSKSERVVHLMDQACSSQQLWYPKGYLSNGWHTL
jgi:hypothetical protein